MLIPQELQLSHKQCPPIKTFSPSLDNQHENFSESIFVIYISITFKQRKDKYENYY